MRAKAFDNSLRKPASIEILGAERQRDNDIDIESTILNGHNFKHRTVAASAKRGVSRAS